MSWSTDLWDQFDNVVGHTQKGIESCERMVSFMKDRCSIEQEYASKLKKLVKNYLPKVEKNEKKKDEDGFTSVKGFHMMLKEIQDLASQRETVAENLLVGAIKDLQNVLNDVKQERRKFIAEGSKQQTSYQNQLQSFERVKKQNERAYKDLEKAQESFSKAEQDSQSPKIDVEKLKQVVSLKQQAFDESKSELTAEASKARKAQHEHFTVFMPQIFQSLQAAEERRVSSVHIFIRLTAQTERQVLPVISKCIEGIEQAAEVVDCKMDSSTVIERYYTGFHPPSDIDIDDGRTATLNKCDSSKTAATTHRKRNTLFTLLRGQKGDETKDDFSHLPPAQQKKQLKTKIDCLKAELAKETAAREGVMKLHDVYQRDPKLGDAASLNKQLEENAQTVNRLQQEIQKYETCLAAVSATISADGSNVAPRLTQTHSSISQPSTVSVRQMRERDEVDTKHKMAPFSREPDSFEEDDDEDDDGSCVALFAFQANSEGTLSMHEGEQFSVVDRDHGDGWTRVRNTLGEVGYVPSSYIECHFDI